MTSCFTNLLELFEVPQTLDDFAATEGNFQHKWPSIRFFKMYAWISQIYLLSKNSKNKTFGALHI